ncbi:MAG: MarR family winged helix-turn-helix transcriptional regulator, partial [Acetobacteraceae bacterium]
MDIPALPERTTAVRRFNRFYTRQIGVLEDGLLRSPFSLTEARILYELAHRPASTASAIARDLALDAGYLSRILARFDARGLISRAASADDG